MFGVAVTALTPEAACHVPGVRRTAVAVLASDVGQAGTLTAAAVAVTVPRRRAAGRAAAQMIAHTFCKPKQEVLMIWRDLRCLYKCLLNSKSHFCNLQESSAEVSQMVSVLTPAVLQQCVAIVTQLTVLACRALAVVQTSQTLAGLTVAGLGVQHVDVVVALAGNTLPPHFIWVSMVTWSTLITARSWTGEKKQNERSN